MKQSSRLKRAECQIAVWPRGEFPGSREASGRLSFRLCQPTIQLCAIGTSPWPTPIPCGWPPMPGWARPTMPTTIFGKSAWARRPLAGAPRRPPLAVRTTYGLRASDMRIFPSFSEGDRTVTDPADFASPPQIRAFFVNYTRLSFEPLPGIGVTAHYWVPDSHTLAGSFTLVNHTVRHTPDPPGPFGHSQAAGQPQTDGLRADWKNSRCCRGTPATWILSSPWAARRRPNTRLTPRCRAACR